MAELLAAMIAALQQTATGPCADMLCLKIVLSTLSGRRIEWPELAAVRGTLCSFRFSRTAAFATFMTSAIEGDTTCSHALRLFLNTLVADCGERRLSTATRDWNCLRTWQTIARVANLLARVATRQWLEAWLVATRDAILAAGTYFVGHILKRCLATPAVRDQIRRARAVSRLRSLDMAGLLALVLAAVEVAITYVSAFEKPNPFLQNLLARFVLVKTLALLLIIPVATQYLLFHLAAIAECLDANLAGTTEALMARFVAKMLAAGHELAANLTTVPSIFIVCIETLPGLRFLTAETKLRGPHLCTWRAWSSMAKFWAWVWALLRHHAIS